MYIFCHCHIFPQFHPKMKVNHILNLSTHIHAFSLKVLIVFIWKANWQREGKTNRERERKAPSACSVLRCPQLPALGREQVSHLGDRNSSTWQCWREGKTQPQALGVRAADFLRSSFISCSAPAPQIHFSHIMQRASSAREKKSPVFILVEEISLSYLAHYANIVCEGSKKK